MHLARRGELDRTALDRALDEATSASVTLRPLTRSLMDQAREWLASSPAGDGRSC